MTKIINFPSNKIVYTTIDNVRAYRPTTGKECLQLYKRFLIKEDYDEVLCCILDEEYYNVCEKHIYKLVEAYYGYER